MKQKQKEQSTQSLSLFEVMLACCSYNDTESKVPD
jgi:hypothetical protein